MTESEILKALSNVEDPDLKKDLVTLNMIRNLVIEGNKVAFDLVLTTPACPLKDMLHNACVNAIKHLVSQEAQIKINVTSDVTSNRGQSEVLKGVKNIIAVASGKGGVGKSTVAMNIAKTLHMEGARVGILDADIYGPSIPVLMNAQDQKPLMDGDKMVPVTVDGIKLMSIGFMIPKEQAVVWRGPMISSAFKQFCNDVVWNDLDYLIIDLPPGTGDVHLSLVQQVPLTGMVFVTNPEEVSVSDTRKSISMYLNPQLKQNMLGIVENMSYFSTPENPEKKYFLFGKDGGKDLAMEFKLDLLGQIPLLEDKSFNNLKDYYVEIVGKMAQKIAILNAER